VFNTSNQIASLVGVIMIPFFTRIAGRKAATVALFLVTTVSAASFYFLGPGQIPLIYGISLFISVSSGPLVALLWSMYADTADYAEWKRGRRATGLIFSAAIFSQKQGWALGAWVALALMQSVGFVANTAQTPRSLHGLVLLMSLIPASLSALSVALVLFYPLTDARLSQIASDLKGRRALDADGNADRMGVAP
jgi:GPH family glycoside/pentoside/hexuronide:cation symporter